MEHSFNIEIAQAYGIEEAILLNNIFFWVQKNEANERHCHEGHYWTYNSVKAFADLFPYMTANTIRRALCHLEEEGLILAGNFNESAYDRTKWYAITEKAERLLKNEKTTSENAHLHLAKNTNGDDKNHKPIPYINTDIKADKTTTTREAKPKDVEAVRAYCEEKGYTFSAEAFFAYYESNGWKVGRNPMKDWKMACITWDQKQKAKPAPKQRQDSKNYRISDSYVVENGIKKYRPIEGIFKADEGF